MEKIYGLTEIYDKNNIIIENSDFFYISRERKIIPHYLKTFIYYFFIINDKFYIHDFEYKHILDDYFINNNKVTNQTHIDLINNINFNILELDKVVFIKIFYTNVGHAIGNILNTIYYVKTNNLDDYDIVVPDDINYSPFLKSIIYLFFDNSRIILISDTTLVKFNKTHVLKDDSHKNDIISHFLIEKLKLTIDYKNISDNTCDNTCDNTYDNICLIKSTITQNLNPENKCFSNDYNNYFISKGFKIIIPENHDVTSLFKIIHNAKNVILSWGCCSYLNSIFVNEKSNVLVLCHKGYEHEYVSVKTNYPGSILNSDWFPKIANKKLILYDLETELNEETKKILDIKINEFV